MKLLRIVLGILAIIPITLLVNHIFFEPFYYGEDSLSEMAYVIIGVPILIFNLWVWGAQSIIELYIYGKQIDQG